MLSFREFYEICEGKKPDTPPQAVPGTYKRSDTGVQTYTLQRYEGPEGKPTKKEVDKLIVKRSGGKEVTKRLKKLAKSVNKIEEDLQQRGQELRQRQLNQMTAHKDRVASYQSAQRERRQAEAERESLKKEIKRELQTEQTPTMEPNYYNKLIARSQLSRKREREAHAQREMEREASAQQVQKRREMKAIMSR